MGTLHDTGGHRLFCVDSGASGLSALLLIHGFPTASWDYARLYPALARTHRVIAPDLLGFGFSDKPLRHDYQIVEQAALVAELLGRLGVRDTAVLAHDYGDSVAQELLARHDEGTLDVRLSSVCLLNGGLFPETHRPRTVQKLLLSPVGPLLSRGLSRRLFDRSMRGLFGASTPPARSDLDAFWELVNEGSGRRIAHRLIRYIPERRRRRDRWVGALRDSGVTVGLINGTADPVSGEHMVARFEEIVGPRHFVRRLSGIGHYPQVEAPAAVLDAYREFLDHALRQASA